MKLKNISLPLIVILVGILFSVYLQGQVPEGVYFSGDAGLKALLAQQLARGDLQFDLIPPTARWIRNLWQDGLYPYEEPFVYNVAGKYYITFPYIFPLVTAPFYAFFGERGLYLTPLFSLWLTWLNLYTVCRSFTLNKYLTSVAIIILIFASYLTFYSTTYWEHTLSVALCFTGITFLLANRNKQHLPMSIALLSGFFFGFAVWFRPEFICVVGLVSGLVILLWILRSSFFLSINKFSSLEPIFFLDRQKLALFTSMFLTVGSFFLTNKLIYGHALGIHAIQVVTKNSSLSERLLSAWDNLQGMSLALLVYFPIIYFPIIYLIVYLLQQIRSKNNSKLLVITCSVTLIFSIISLGAIAISLGSFRNIIEFFLLPSILLVISLFAFKDIQLKLNLPLVLTYLACILFVIGVSILVPVGTAGLIAGGKQWGPRFLLLLMPIISLVTAIELHNLQTQNKLRAKYWLYFLITCLLILGIYKNTLQGTAFLQKNIINTIPAVNFLNQNSNQTIAISHQFVGQVLEPAINKDKIFFKVDNQPDLIKLSQALVQQQQAKFTYICYPNRPCNLPNTYFSDLLFFQGDRQYQITITNLGTFGKYPIYEMSIR